MTYRYLSNLCLALVAGFIVVATQAFAVGTTAWLAFAAGVIFAIAGIYSMRRASAPERGLGAGISVLGVLMVIESLLASGATMTWLSFAGALGVLGMAIASLTIHELSTERVVHSLEVSPGSTREPVSSSRTPA